MSRAGALKDRKDGPERRCIATGDVQPKAGLVRFVLGPDGSVVPDILGKLPGRGVWVTAERGALDKAVGKGMFSRAFKAPATVPDGLVDRVDAALVRRLVDLISLARKSGDAVAGYEKVKDWLIKGQAVVLVQASDGSARGKSKLSTPEGGTYVGCLSADELGAAFGRQTVIHAAVASGGLGQRVVEEAHRVKGMRETGGDTRRREGKEA
ncbi:MAG: RNA-binding protein [Marinibacterium sp.]